MFKILVLAQDLSDPALQKRVAMLKQGGATVSVAGFNRSAAPVPAVDGVPTIEFNKTFNGAFRQRIGAVLRTVLFLQKKRALFEVDLILARNLEMLAIAVRGQSIAQSKPRVVYEVLDIHRLMLGSGLHHAALRWLENRLAKTCSGVITSSPAYIAEYFKRRTRITAPIRLVENKVLDTANHVAPVAAEQRPHPPPWIIGWYGILRCRESLFLLKELAEKNPGKIEVVIRGRPALDQIPTFREIVATSPGLNFQGSYRNPDDLAAMYGQVHFTWAIDMFEEGQNSSWLLPNRIYEGGAYGSIPLALADVETGRFMERRKIGVRLQQPLTQSLQAFFDSLTPEIYQKLAADMLAVPQSAWISDAEDCSALVAWLQNPIKDQDHG